MHVRQHGLIAVILVAALAAGLLSSAAGTRAGGPALQATPPDVFAEALDLANLRSGPGIDYPQVGEITPGTRYRVLAQHRRVPWVQLDVRAVAPQQAWVYIELVNVVGPLASVPFVDDFPPEDATLIPTSAPTTPTAAPTTAPPDAASAPPAEGASPEQAATPAEQNEVRPPTATPTEAAPAPTATPEGPIATLLGEANVRYGPALEYGSIAMAQPGETYRVLEFHALYPWVHIAIPGAPGGGGWVYQDLVEVTGDTSMIPVSSATRYTQPELTPTPQMVLPQNGGAVGLGQPSGRLASTLGAQLHEFLLESGFVPFTNRLGSVFVLDLSTGDGFTINGGVAFSGMSLTKIPILVTYFQRHSGALNDDDAFLIADTMMCSENITTNDLLALIGEGDPYIGAQRVTGMMQGLGLNGTFLVSPYSTGAANEDIDEDRVVTTIMTGADQTSTQPDPVNQIVPSDLGALLAGVYQCAQDGTGLLIDRYPDAFTPQECRQMLRAMDSNEIGVFLEAGVPEGTPVMHKHGWISDTHGDAGLVLTPQGAFVFVAALYGKDWLEFDQSSPVLAELARRTWNAIVPEQPVGEFHESTVPATCDPLSDPVMDALLTTQELPPPNPAALSTE